MDCITVILLVSLMPIARNIEQISCLSAQPQVCYAGQIYIVALSAMIATHPKFVAYQAIADWCY